MRVDLRLQRIELRDPKLFRRLFLLFHQQFHLAGHMVVGVDQLADLVADHGLGHRNRRAVLRERHLVDDRRDARCDGPGLPDCDEEGRRDARRAHEGELEQESVRPREKGAVWQHRHHQPARRLYVVKPDVDLFAEHAAHDEVVRGHQRFVNFGVVQPVERVEGMIGGGHT